MIIQLLDSGPCTDAMLSRMLRSFYADDQLDNNQIDKFVANCRRGAQGEPVSPALVQGYLLAYKDDWAMAIDCADKLIHSQTHGSSRQQDDTDLGAFSG